MSDTKTIAAGQLDKLVTIRQPSTTKDTFGQPATGWSTVLRTRARIEEIGATERFSPNQFTTQVSHSITIRYPGDLVRITTGMQVLYRASTYRVQAVNNVQAANRKLVLLCQEINSDQ